MRNDYNSHTYIPIYYYAHAHILQLAFETRYTPHALPDPRNTTRHPLRIHLRRVDYNATEHYSFSMLTFFLEPFFFFFFLRPPPFFI